MPAGRTNIQINLNSQSSNAEFSFDTFDTPSFGQNQTIRFFDKTATVAITEMRFSGIENGDRQYQCSGVDYNANLYNSRISYELYWSYQGGETTGEWIKPRLRQHFNEIANALGLNLIFRVYDNFQVPCEQALTIQNYGQSEQRYESHTGTVAELVDRLIGWSRDIPNMEYCVRIQGRNLYVIQRGSENLSINLDNTGKIVKYPTFSRRKIFTAWSDSSGYIYSSDSDLTKKPFTGTISFQSQSLRYEDGYLMEEISGDIETTFTYVDADPGSTENAKYLSSKTVTNTDTEERTVTEYQYMTTENEKYLRVETEKHESYDGNDWIVDKTVITTHSPLGNGWYGTTTSQIDGAVGSSEEEIISTSLGQGSSGGKVSQYMVDSTQEGLTDNSDINQRRVSIGGVARLRSTYPVFDTVTLRRIANNIDNMNGLTEETVDLDVLGLTVAVDIDRRVIFNNQSWYVVSNNIEITPFHKIQRLNLVRWY